jgi:hypothetical protein
MSAARRPRASGRARVTPPVPRGRRSLPWLLVLPALVVAALGWWAFRSEAPSATPPERAAAPWGDAALATGPVEAYAHGVALADSGRVLASLPYLHRAALAPAAPWQAWRAYASALHNVAMMGVPDPLLAAEAPPRSTFERIALMREATARIDRAIELTNVPADRAIAQLTRAQFLRTWGYGWDALADFHAAGEIDPTWRDQGPFYAALMRNPTSATP